MGWMIGGALYVAIGGFFWALCVAAGRADDEAERRHDETTRR